MRCSECLCDVHDGLRVITCQTGGACCCEHLPRATGAQREAILERTDTTCPDCIQYRIKHPRGT